MSAISKEEALSIAIKYLGERYAGRLTVTDQLPEAPIYGSDSFGPCWVIYVPMLDMLRVGGSTYLIISKESDKILFHGMVGEW